LSPPHHRSQFHFNSVQLLISVQVTFQLQVILLKNCYNANKLESPVWSQTCKHDVAAWWVYYWKKHVRMDPSNQIR